MFVRWTDDRKRKVLEFATALNVGAGGVLLAMHRGAPVGTHLSIQIPLAVIATEVPLSGSVTHLKAEVVRVQSQDKAHFVAACFTAPLGSNTSGSSRP